MNHLHSLLNCGASTNLLLRTNHHNVSDKIYNHFELWFFYEVDGTRTSEADEVQDLVSRLMWNF